VCWRKRKDHEIDLDDTGLLHLQDLTARLVDRGCQEYKLWDMPGGATVGRGLQKDDLSATLIADVPNGAQFVYHQHDQTEWLIVRKGTMIVYLGDDPHPRELWPGDGVKIEPHTSHRVVARGDLSIVAVTIPPDAEYPDGP